MGIHIFFVLHIHKHPPDLSCAAASKVRACSEEGEQQRQICLSMLVPSTLCPFPQRGGAELFLGGPAEPEANAQAAVSISESRGRGHPGAQASQKYTQIAEEINIPPNGASSTALPPSTLGLSFGRSVPAGLCALLSPRNKHTDLGHCCLHYHCTFYLLALSLVGPAANISSQCGEEQRVDAFVSVLLEQQGLLSVPSESTVSLNGEAGAVLY